MWVICELVAIATDLAEFLGAALGFYLLFGMPLWIAGLITAVATFLILGLERYGFRPLEAVITALVGVVAFSYLIETFLDKPRLADRFYHAVVPQFSGHGKRPARHRHSRRDRHATCDLSALGADPGPHRHDAIRSSSASSSAMS